MRAASICQCAPASCPAGVRNRVQHEISVAPTPWPARSNDAGAMSEAPSDCDSWGQMCWQSDVFDGMIHGMVRARVNDFVQADSVWQCHLSHDLQLISFHLALANVQ